MNELSFPNAVTATAAVVGLNAALASSGVGYATAEESYVVDQMMPTIGMSKDIVLGPSHDNFAARVADFYFALSERQQPLGVEFEAVWDANVNELYEF